MIAIVRRKVKGLDNLFQYDMNHSPFFLVESRTREGFRVENNPKEFILLGSIEFDFDRISCMSYDENNILKRVFLQDDRLCLVHNKEVARTNFRYCRRNFETYLCSIYEAMSGLDIMFYHKSFKTRLDDILKAPILL